MKPKTEQEEDEELFNQIIRAVALLITSIIWAGSTNSPQKIIPQAKQYEDYIREGWNGS